MRRKIGNLSAKTRDPQRQHQSVGGSYKKKSIWNWMYIESTTSRTQHDFKWKIGRQCRLRFLVFTHYAYALLWYNLYDALTLNTPDKLYHNSIAFCESKVCACFMIYIFDKVIVCVRVVVWKFFLILLLLIIDDNLSLMSTMLNCPVC